MECSEEILVASLEPEPIGTLVGCLVPALPARWSMNKEVAKVAAKIVQHFSGGRTQPYPKRVKRNSANEYRMHLARYPLKLLY